MDQNDHNKKYYFRLLDSFASAFKHFCANKVESEKIIKEYQYVKKNLDQFQKQFNLPEFFNFDDIEFAGLNIENNKNEVLIKILNNNLIL